MRKRTFRILAAALVLSGCAKTPGYAIVREKGSQSLENYREADGSGVNALAESLQTPDVYQASAASEDGIFTLNCNADVQVPDAEQVSVWQVTPKDFSQEWIDQVTEAFFGDAPVYNDAGSNEPTKANAPETRETEEVTPGFGVYYVCGENGEKEYRDDLFFGTVRTEEGDFQYKLKRMDSLMPMDITVSRIRPGGNTALSDASWIEAYLCDPEGTVYSEDELRQQAGIAAQEAAALADTYMEKLGLKAVFSAKSTSLCINRDLNNAEDPNRMTDAGWMINYTRDIDGFPVTDERNDGGDLESMESTLETWGYEKICFVVNQEGLQLAQIRNLYELGERQVENVQLLSFPEIADIFEQMLEIQNADIAGQKKSAFDVSQVTLGYMRVYDPGADAFSGLLVPVWDFFGSKEQTDEYEGEEFSFFYNDPQSSFLTVNAADGTVIDRSYGY